MRTKKNLVTTLLHVVHRYFMWIIIVSYVVAAIAPMLGTWIQNAGSGSLTVFQNQLVFSLPLFLLASILFNAGLGVKILELKQLFRNPFILLSGLLGNYAAPLVLIIGLSFAIKLWHDSEEAQQILVGLALVVAMPIAGSSTAWVQNANGNLVLSLGLVLFTTALSPLFSPLVFHTVGFVTINDYSEDLHELASNGLGTFFGVWVILPTLLGILTHWFIGEHRIAKAKPYLKLVNYLVLTLLNYSNASLILPKVISQPDIDFLIIILAIVVVLCMATFTAGYFLARLLHADRNDMVSLMFCFGMNNNGTGLVLASVFLIDHPQVMLPIIVYNLVQQLVGALVDFFMFQQQPEKNRITVN